MPLGVYEDRLRDAILNAKRPAHEPLTMALGGLLAHRWQEELLQFRPDVIVPVPMYWLRRLLRGVNSPEILSAELSRVLGTPVARLLIRQRNTLPQKELLPRERFKNVRGAFRLRGKRIARLEGSRVLLVDDILTTGATCSEAARVLKQAGVAAVAVAVVARALGPT